MVTNNFSESGLDLNGKVSLKQPTALDWGPDGRLYVTEVTGSVKVLTVAFGDSSSGNGDGKNSFYVTKAETLDQVKNIPNFNDNGDLATGSKIDERQVTGINVVQQFDANGQPVMIDGKPAVSVYVTSSDSRIGAGKDGEDRGLDTNSGVITRLDQTADGWNAMDIVRGLARSEENHALNGLEVIQEVDAAGNLMSERMIVANGGNTNTGAPSNNFAGQQETAYSGAILEIDLDQLKSMDIQTDSNSGRQYIYDIPTLDDPTRPGSSDNNDPFGGNDGLNGGKIDPNGPVQIYSPGYRNSYDVEVTEDGRVWTYDNGANNSWGGRPVGEAGDDGDNVDLEQLANYIAINLNNGDKNTGDTINLEDWSPKNYDQFHEITRSDDLSDRELSAGQGGATTYDWLNPDTGETLQLVYGGHPNPIRASGSKAGILYTPKDGIKDSFLLLSNLDNGSGISNFDQVIAFLQKVEKDNKSVSIGDLTDRVIGVEPGELYYITQDGNAYLASDYSAQPGKIAGSTVLGKTGMPADFDKVVDSVVPVEGNYLEGGYTDGALDSGKGSINGLTEYTSTLLDANGIKMSGALLAASLNQGSLIVMGRDENGVMQTTAGSEGQTLAGERTTINVSGAPLGLTSIGDDLEPFNNQTAFQGSIWTTVFKQNGPFIEILQPKVDSVPQVGSDSSGDGGSDNGGEEVVIDPTDQDDDGIDHIHDPFEFSADNGFDLNAGERILIDFDPTGSPYPGTILDTGLMGSALDGKTPNRDAKTAAESIGPEQQQDGLFDLAGNMIPGGNAPIFQIKKVAGGIMLGSDNGARDAMHVGIKPGEDVGRLAISTTAKNWIPSVSDGIKPGQLTGILLGDGTQANFLRLVFGTVIIDGKPQAGFEVGYEIADTGYTTLARVAVPELNGKIVSLDLHLGVDIHNGFAVTTGYKLSNSDESVDIDLNGFTLPAGIFQDILTGKHTISDGDTTVASGAAVGFVAETSKVDAASDKGLAGIDFYDLKIDAFGKEILAGTAQEVGTVGTDGVDTIVYTGTETDLASLDASVENFDGSGSNADFTITGNSGDNVLIAGSGSNTFTGGEGADSIRGTFGNINGSVITDLKSEDELVILDKSLSAGDVSYELEAGGVKLTFKDPQTGATSVVHLQGEQFEGFDPASGASAFRFEQTELGTRVSYSNSSVLYRINAGGETITAKDGGPDWIGDTTPGFSYLVDNGTKIYSSKDTDEETEIDLSGLGDDMAPWELFKDERYDGTKGEPDLEYTLPVTAGNTYSITLYYTEAFKGIFKDANNRVFNVEVDGSVPSEFSGINPLQEARERLGPDATQEDLLGLALSRTYTFTATDDVINLVFNRGDENPKINAIEVRQLGVGVSVPDTQAPVVQSIVVEELMDSDSPIFATVTISDNSGIDVSSIKGDELVFTGISPASVTLAPSDAVTTSSDGKTVTVKYQLTPPEDTNAWSNGSFTVGIAANSYADLSGNGTAAYEIGFTLGDRAPVTLELDFEQPGVPLAEGGFDGVLGGIVDDSVAVSIENGKLFVNTSNSDISQGKSANDFVKFVDLSDPATNEIELSTRFDNSFPTALAEQGLSTATIPGYAQQGIVFGLGSQGENELVKLTFGGNKGNSVQIWSNPDKSGGINTIYKLSDLLSGSSAGLEDIASVAMTLTIDKAAGTVIPVVTFYDAAGTVLGGLSDKPTAGFITATIETLPAQVLANLQDTSAKTAVGVTSNDYGELGSFKASWDYLNLNTLEAANPEQALPTIVINDLPSVTETSDTGNTLLAFALTSETATTGSFEIAYSLDGGASVKQQTVIFDNGKATLEVAVANDAIDDGTDTVSIKLISSKNGGYLTSKNADMAIGQVLEDEESALTTAEQIFANADLEASESYSNDAVGSAIVTITPGSLDVQQSNYGSSSFKVMNTGDKKIAAVFFDVRTALYGDSVFDPDGKGGDTAFKDWTIDSDGSTGAVQPSDYDHYFFAGADLDPSNAGTNGGYRGALIKFSATIDGGFTKDETVGFSGDMDPNSIAGMKKSGPTGVNTDSMPGWDVGGVSGAELIGSKVYVRFTDGTTASTQLMADGSQSGAQALVIENAQSFELDSITVNGVAPGESGQYDADKPIVLLEGSANAWVRVVMTKGHQPVANENENLVDIVDWRLSKQDFQANNAAEFQIVDIQLGADGKAEISDQFVYDSFNNSTSSFDGDNKLPIGFIAAVIEDPILNEGFALGSISEPIILVGVE